MCKEEYGNILAEQDEQEGEYFEDGTPKFTELIRDQVIPEHFPHPF